MGTQHEAPAGTIWVCQACGKTARDRTTSDAGWDESCALNAILWKEDFVDMNSNGRAIRLLMGGQVE